VQLTYVFSELGNGLRRNVSMTVAVIVTIFVSLTLVGLGLLLNAQAHKAEEYWGDRLQITVFMCTPVSQSATCIDGKASEPQKQNVEQILTSNPEVASYHFESSATAYAKFREVYKSSDDAQSAVLDSVPASDFPESYWVTLKDPNRFQGVKEAVQGQPGVGDVRDLRSVLKPLYAWINGLKWGAISVAAFLVVAAVLQVGNTIRLAAFARRREIGIMRLVGASSWYVQLPFLLEALFAALVGVALSSLAIIAFMWVVVYHRLADSRLVAWITWSDAGHAIALITVTGLGLTLLPTVLLTRRYLRV
jgi:cell division transport system permease protein